MGHGLPQNCLPFLSIQCHAPPVYYARNSDILPHTFSHLSLGLPTFLLPSDSVLKYFLNHVLVSIVLKKEIGYRYFGGFRSFKLPFPRGIRKSAFWNAACVYVCMYVCIVYAPL